MTTLGIKSYKLTQSKETEKENKEYSDIERLNFQILNLRRLIFTIIKNNPKTKIEQHSEKAIKITDEDGNIFYLPFSEK